MGSHAINLGTVYHEYGEVVAAGTPLAVRVGDAVFEAARAVGCLVEPLPDDKVLLCRDTLGRCYVLSVLERTTTAPTTVTLGDGAHLRTAGGAVRLFASGELHLESASKVAVTSAEFSLGTVSASICADRLAYSGGAMEAVVTRVRIFADTVDSTLGRMYQAVTRSFRRIEEVDDVRAGQIDYRAVDTASVHAGCTFVTAATVVKVDAAQVHVG